MSLARFGEVFCEKTFSDFLRRWTIEAFEGGAGAYRDDPGGAQGRRARLDLLRQGRRTSGRSQQDAGLQPHLGIAADFFRSLVPRLVRSRDFQRTLGKLRKRDVRTATQLRIELDWYLFSETSLKPTIGTREDYCIPAERIVAKIKASLPDAAEAVFVSCDEKFIFASRADITRHVLADTGCAILWKADLLGEAARGRPRHRCMRRSSTSNCAPQCRTSSAIRDRPSAISPRSSATPVSAIAPRVSHREISSTTLPGPVLGSRTDHGTQVDPHAACGLPGPPADT